MNMNHFEISVLVGISFMYCYMKNVSFLFLHLQLCNCSSLYGAPVLATDLRAGAALVLAGMSADGTTHIQGVGHIDRGYEKLDKKFRLLGASIQRIRCLPAELTL